MSRIFDALQRSESERSGAATAALPQGPDLLKQAERRVVSTWEAGAANFGREAANTEEDREAALAGSRSPRSNHINDRYAGKAVRGPEPRCIQPICVPSDFTHCRKPVGLPNGSGESDRRGHSPSWSAIAGPAPEATTEEGTDHKHNSPRGQKHHLRQPCLRAC